MSTKTNDPKQTAPETEPVVDDIKTEPVTPEVEEKAAKKAAKKDSKEKEPKASKEPKETKEPKEKKETKKEIEADLAAEKDKYLRLLAEYDNFRRAAPASARTSMPMSAARRSKSSCRCTTACRAHWNRLRTMTPPARASRAS